MNLNKHSGDVPGEWKKGNVMPLLKRRKKGLESQFLLFFNYFDHYIYKRRNGVLSTAAYSFSPTCLDLSHRKLCTSYAPVIKFLLFASSDIFHIFVTYKCLGKCSSTSLSLHRIQLCFISNSFLKVSLLHSDLSHKNQIWFVISYCPLVRSCSKNVP